MIAQKVRVRLAKVNQCPDSCNTCIDSSYDEEPACLTRLFWPNSLANLVKQTRVDLGCGWSLQRVDFECQIMDLCCTLVFSSILLCLERKTNGDDCCN